MKETKEVPIVDLSEWRDWQKDKLTQFLINDLKTHIDGLELQLRYMPTDNLSLEILGERSFKIINSMNTIQQVIDYVEQDDVPTIAKEVDIDEISD